MAQFPCSNGEVHFGTEATLWPSPFVSLFGLAGLVIIAMMSGVYFRNCGAAECPLRAQHNAPMILIDMSHQDVLLFLQHRIAFDIDPVGGFGRHVAGQTFILVIG